MTMSQVPPPPPTMAKKTQKIGITPPKDYGHLSPCPERKLVVITLDDSSPESAISDFNAELYHEHLAEQHHFMADKLEMRYQEKNMAKKKRGEELVVGEDDTPSLDESEETKEEESEEEGDDKVPEEESVAGEDDLQEETPSSDEKEETKEEDLEEESDEEVDLSLKQCEMHHAIRDHIKQQEEASKDTKKANEIEDTSNAKTLSRKGLSDTLPPKGKMPDNMARKLHPVF